MFDLCGRVKSLQFAGFTYRLIVHGQRPDLPTAERSGDVWL
jgi:hypothetical protein